MKRLTVAFCSMLALVVVACNDSATNSAAPGSDTAATKTDTPSTAATPPPPPMDSAAMAKAMMDYATIGEPHKMLAAANGKWDAEVSTWMDPSKPPMTNKATSVNTMILGGRYQQSKHTGSFMGAPFEGVSIVGYDNSKKLFVSSWVDNMGTGIMNLEGPWDAASKSITFTGKMIDPATGKECAMREVMTFIDDKNQKMEMYGTPAGAPQEMKMMEIKYTRK
jgi:hypothetical protein